MTVIGMSRIWVAKYNWTTVHGIDSRKEIRYRSLHRYGIKTTVDVHGYGFLYVVPKTLTLVLHQPFPALSPHFAFVARQVRLKRKAKDCKQANFVLLSGFVPFTLISPLPTEPLILPQKESSAHLAVRDRLGAMVKVF